MFSDLIKRYSDILSPVSQGLSQIGQAVGNEVHALPQQIQNVVPNLDEYKYVPGNIASQFNSQLPQRLNNITVDAGNQFGPLGSAAGNFFGAMNQSIAQAVPPALKQIGYGLQRQVDPLHNLSPIAPNTQPSDVGKILGGVGAVTMPLTSAAMGAFNVPFQGVQTLLQQRRLPTGSEIGQSFNQGVQQGNLFGPLGVAASPLLNPVTSKLGTSAVAKIASSGLNAGTGNAAYQALQPGANWQNVGIAGLQGAVFGVGGETIGQAGKGLIRGATNLKDSAIAGQAADELKGGDLLAKPTVAPYAKAFNVDPLTEKEIVGAVDSIQSGKLDDPLAQQIISSTTKEFLPSNMQNAPLPDQANAWDYILSRKYGTTPTNVPQGLQGLDQAILHYSGGRLLQTGKIDFGAKVGGKPEPLPWEQETQGISNFDKDLGTQVEQKLPKNVPNSELPEGQQTRNEVNLPITGATEQEKIGSAINNSVRVQGELNSVGDDALRAGLKLSPEDVRLAEQYQEGKSIEKLAGQAQNPKAFTDFMNKITNYYDLRLAMDRAVGGNTPLRENYLRQRWDLSNPVDFERFNELLKQQGAKEYNGYSNQPRVFNNYAQGEAAGFTRQNENILGDLKDDFQGAGSVLSKQALLQGLNEAVPGKISTAGKGMTPDGKPFTNSNIQGLEGISISPDVNRQLKGFQPITDQDLFKNVQEKGFAQGLKDTGVWNTFTSLYDHSTNPMKHFLLNFSGFHSINIGIQYAGKQLADPVNLIKGLGKSVPAFFSETATQGIINGFKNKAVRGQDYSVFDAGLRSGVNMGRSTPVTGISKLNPFSVMSRAIFDRELYTMKLHLVDTVFGDGKMDPQSPQGIAAGKEINTIMGEVNTKTANINPNTMKWLSRGLLAPQFTYTKYKTLGDAATNWKDVGNINSQGNLARQAVIGKTIVLGSLSTLGTLLMTGKFPNLQQILTNYTTNPTIQTNLTNPKGKKLDIALPNSYISEPSRPIAGLLKGSTDELTHYGEARLNPGLSTALSAYTNKDYYGNPLVNPDSPTPVANQLLQNVGVGRIPIGAQNVVKLAQGKITPAQAAIQIAGLRTSISPDDPTSKYFTALKQATDSISNPNVKNEFTGVLHPITKDQDGNPLVEKTPFTKTKQYSALLDSPQLLSTETAFQQSQPNHSPIWDANPSDLRIFLHYKQLNTAAPGSAEEKQLLKNDTANGGNLLSLIQSNGAWGANLASSVPQSGALVPPTPSAYVQSQLKQPKPNYNDPQVSSYMAQHLDYINAQRALVDEAPLDKFGNIQGSKNYSAGGSSGGFGGSSYAQNKIKTIARQALISHGRKAPKIRVVKLRSGKQSVARVKAIKSPRISLRPIKRAGVKVKLLT